MLLRSARFVLAATVAIGLAGCTGSPGAPAAPASPATTAAAESAAASSPMPTAVGPTATPPDTGNVVAPVSPSLSVEPIGAVAIRVTLVDPPAKAWRVTVAGARAKGAAAADSWTLTVETGDVAPVITTTETLDGVVGQPQEQRELEAGPGPGRVCSLTVPVCVRAASVVLPHDGNGTLALELGRTDTATALAVTGATATWPKEPFVLGKWTTTAAFPWGA